MMNLFKKKPDSAGGEAPLPDTPADLFIHSRWLQFYDRFKPLLVRFGVNYPQFRLILGYKLYMDAADPNFMSTLNSGTRRAGRNAFFRGLWLYALVSLLFTVLTLSMGRASIIGLGAALVYYSLMYLTVLVQAFSGSLLDVRDVSILETRGVSEQTRSAAQTAHTLVYILSLFAALLGLPILASFYAIGILGGFIYLASALLLLVVNYVLSIGIYAAVLRFFHGERLKNMLSMIQIAILVLSAVLPQLPNILNQLSPHNALASAGFNWYMALFYPLWFAGPNLWVSTGQFNPNGILSLLALAAFGLSLVAYGPAMRRLTNNLNKLAEGGAEPAPTGLYFRLMRQLVPVARHQRTLFNLSWRTMQADADYKMRVYPQIATGIVVLIPLGLLAANLDGERANVWQALQGSWVWNLAQVFSLTGLATAVYFLRFSQNPAAMKIFATTPGFDKAVLFREAIRTVYLRLAVPLVLLMGLVTLIFLPPLKVLSNTLLALGVGLIMIMLYGSFMSSTAPYSRVFQTGQVNTGATFGASILSFMIALFSGVVGAFLPWWAIGSAGALILGVSWFVLGRSYQNVNFVLPGEPDF